jgi:hypothetical protein
MKKGLVILVALSIALMMGASMLVAQEKAPVEKEKGTCKKEMKLTDEQKAKIDEMRTNLRLKMIDLKAEREKLAIALKTEMKKPEPSMQEIEGIVKKLSAVREKIQLATIEHRLAMRKLVGDDACKMMMGGGGMGGCGEGDEGCGGEMGRGMRGNARMGMHEGRGMQAPRTMVVKTDGSGCTMAMGAPGAGCGMHAMGAGCGGGAAQGACKVIMMKKGGACSPQVHDKWAHRMFRPWGKQNCCASKMGKGGSHSCGADAMKGGCKMGASAEGCMKKCTEKEIKCTVEVKEEPKK